MKGWKWVLWVPVVLLASTVFADSSADGWHVIEQERGITVSARDEPGRELPTLRGQGIIEGDVLLVLSIVLDAEGSTEWAEGADEVKMVKEIDPRTHIIYTRTDTPWPVSDRDMFMKRVTEVVKAGEEFRLRVVCLPNERPEREGVIRIKDCDSHFVLRKVDANHTAIEYQVNVDPGGSLPKFLIRWASRKVPFDTLINLEEFAKKAKSRARYARDMSLWASAH